MQNSATDLLSPVLAAQLFDPPSADSEYNVERQIKNTVNKKYIQIKWKKGCRKKTEE